jgi:predicted transcriptional regulator of viral defense system
MEGSPRVRPHTGRNGADPLDLRIADIAARQHAVIAVRQIVALGLSASAVRNRVAQGRLHRVHRGVVSVVPLALLTRRGRIMAATLACEIGTASSHRAAGALYELRLAMRRWIDVTTPGSKPRRRPGIRIHSGATLTAADLTVVDNIPCTSLARTLLDVAEDATSREIEWALDRAEQQRIPAEHRVGSTPTRTDLEEACLAIARASPFTPTVAATSASCCWAGASCASPGAR